MLPEGTCCCLCNERPQHVGDKQQLPSCTHGRGTWSCWDPRWRRLQPAVGDAEACPPVPPALHAWPRRRALPTERSQAPCTAGPLPASDMGGHACTRRFPEGHTAPTVNSRSPHLSCQQPLQLSGRSNGRWAVGATPSDSGSPCPVVGGRCWGSACPPSLCPASAAPVAPTSIFMCFFFLKTAVLRSNVRTLQFAHLSVFRGRVGASARPGHGTCHCPVGPSTLKLAGSPTGQSTQTGSPACGRLRRPRRFGRGACWRFPPFC